ncbi:hypothetical protein [Halorubrum pallidum]|uniref:Uncharacterized protein n=1 Tax=Halorubrum pallidum TaxID=1526114 RepID=A0ABD5T5D3_9EURY
MHDSEQPERKPNPIDAPDTNNATYLGWSDIPQYEEWPADYHPPNKRDYFQYLDRLNSGLQNGPKYQNKRYETYCLNRWLILCMSSHLRMSDRLRQLAVDLFNGLPRSKFGVRIHVSALVTCGYVIHQHDPRRECHPQTSAEAFDPFVEQERVNLRIPRKQYASLYGKIEHRVRTGQLTPSKHDAYEVDPAGLQAWREINEEWDDSWL